MNSSLLNPLFSYIFKRIFLSFLFFLLILSVLLLFIFFVQYSDIFITTQITLNNLIIIIVRMFPLSLEFAIPLAVISSLLYVIYIMIIKNEILAIELCGISRTVIVAPFLVFAVSVFIVNLILSIFVFPYSIVGIKEKAIEFARDGLVNSMVESRINDDIPDTMLYFNKRAEDGRLMGLFLFQKRDTKEHMCIFAEAAKPEVGLNGLSLNLRLEKGKIVDKQGEYLRLIDYKTGELSIDIAELVEKKIKHIRGISTANISNNKYFHICDSIYLALVNVWIALVVISVFVGRRSEITFFKYILFFIFVGFFYVGFRVYHFLSENEVMGPVSACLSIVLIVTLLFILIKWWLARDVRFV